MTEDEKFVDVGTPGLFYTSNDTPVED